MDELDQYNWVMEQIFLIQKTLEAAKEKKNFFKSTNKLSYPYYKGEKLVQMRATQEQFENLLDIEIKDMIKYNINMKEK